MSDYILPVGIAILVSAAVLLIAFRNINKDRALGTKYDERQKIVRGKAYRFGFYVTVVANAALLILSTSTDAVRVLGYTAFMIPIIAGVTAQFSYCIFKDGYVGLNTNMTRFVIFMAFVAAFNLLLAVSAIANGTMLVDGTLRVPFLNLLVGIMALVMFADLLIKKLLDGREE